jgi:2-polyprenyl-6-methoxyphenol hydroxylase-like FAD-dependent oxidoreductase
VNKCFQDSSRCRLEYGWALIERSPDFCEFPLVDRDPVSAWTHGCVALIDDAAHPMQPSEATQIQRRLWMPAR